MDISLLHELFLNCSSVSIDTRRIESNSMFFALKGDNFDANTFASEALNNGASYVVIDDDNYFIDERTILVKNSLTALQELAKYHRAFLNIPIVALTGSNGKTTTKELINAVLSKKFVTKATVGNLNNHIGVPLTLLSFSKSTQIGIVEMGANHQKEIAFLCDIANPDYGYITNFGKAHLEGFGGVEGVIKGKSEMYDYLTDNHKMVFVNLEDPIQIQKTANIKQFSFGVNKFEANLSVKSIMANPLVTVGYNDILISSHLIGLYNSNNIIAAIAIGKYFDVSDLAIKEAIENYIPENNRSQLLFKGTNEVILDAYNANPSSMKVAIENFIRLDKPNKIAILGDMFELGTESFSEHQLLVKMMLQHEDVKCYFIGKAFYKNEVQSNHLTFYESFDSFSTHLKEVSFDNNLILIKGSRGMALERTLNYF